MPAVSRSLAGVQEAPQGRAQAKAGHEEARGRVAGADQGMEEATLGSAAGGAVTLSPLHPFNAIAPMAGMSCSHLFNTLGNPGLSALHVFTITPPPRDYSQKVHQFSSRVRYTSEA